MSAPSAAPIAGVFAAGPNLRAAGARQSARQEVRKTSKRSTLVRPYWNLSIAERLKYHLPSSPNVTLSGSGLQATVFLPHATRGLYRSTRYDWGSMIGHIVLPKPIGRGNVTLCTSVRPRPHQPLATDHVMGMAAEFGCGVHGALCHTSDHSAAANGVLGYGDAGRGGTFAKIGVGTLVRPHRAQARAARHDG